VHYAPRPGGASLAHPAGLFARLAGDHGRGRLAVAAPAGPPVRSAHPRPGATLDLEWFCGWFLGRRVFLTIGILFHGHLLVLMNIGMFAPIMLLTYMVFLSGPELASMLRGLGQALARLGVPGIPADVRAGCAPIPTEDPRLPHLHRDAARLPTWAMLGSLALATGAIVLAAPGLPGARTCVVGGLLALLVGDGLIAWRRHGRRSLAAGSDAGSPDRPWAYGPLGAVPGRRAGRLSHHRGRGVVHARQAVPQDVPRRRAGAVSPVADAHAHGPGLGTCSPRTPRATTSSSRCW
jgi:hypothetical protein